MSATGKKEKEREGKEGARLGGCGGRIVLRTDLPMLKIFFFFPSFSVRPPVSFLGDGG